MLVCKGVFRNMVQKKKDCLQDRQPRGMGYSMNLQAVWNMFIWILMSDFCLFPLRMNLLWQLYDLCRGISLGYWHQINYVHSFKIVLRVVYFSEHA
jgi:hypothetical protein